MKVKTFFIALVELTLLTSLSYAKIWIVDNNGGSRIADFTAIQAAHDGATDGDTLYVIGSGVTYGDIICTKKISIVGTGYFLAENQQTITPTASSMLSEITFSEGSENSLIIGITILRIHIRTNSITIKRNYMNSDGGGDLATGHNIVLHDDVAYNVFISQNYIIIGGSWSSSHNIKVGSNLSNIIISNNYMFDYRGHWNVGVAADSRISFYNNIMNKSMTSENSNIYNNIGNSFPAGNNSTKYCIFYSNVQENDRYKYPNCKFEINGSDIFVGIAGNSTDGQYQLKEGSPAIGAGLNGVDCGIFGGANPYVLSGMPPIPAIYQADIATTGSIDDGLPVKIKVKAHN